ncbi:hypothetical protein ACFPOB_26020 [Bosea eneae]|uniref:Uncharacterized protein n=1 Tax=Bosea eneae TaxID=151454 RepID=A0ABW0J1W1_9HYPH
MSRIRKAWRVTVDGCESSPVVFAPTAARARAEVIADVRDAWGCSFKKALAYIRACHRAPERDVELPERHPLAPQLSDGVLHCVVHAYGGTGLKAGYRDHFYADADDWQMQAALYHCLFRVYRRDKGRHGQPDMIMYELTDLGRNVARGEAQTYPGF